MIASLDRHLKEAGSSISIAKDREFVNSRKVLEGKARFLREHSPVPELSFLPAPHIGAVWGAGRKESSETGLP